jgi:hypothetical protein
MKRGIIASPANIKFEFPSALNLSSGISPETIRYFLLYWDEIIIPDNNLISFGVPDEQDLIQCGCVYRPMSRFNGHISGHEIGHYIIKEQYKLAEFFSNDPNVDWVIHQAESNQIYLPQSETIERSVVRLNLTNALPVPTKDVNINEILEFKIRRQDELISLHQAIDDLYIEILESPDQKLTGKKVMTRLTESIDSLDKVTKEKFRVFGKFDMQAQYNIKGKDLLNFTGVGSAPAILEATGHTFDALTWYTLPIGVATGFAVGMISGLSVNIKRAQTPSYAADKLKLSYLSQASKVNIIS